MGLAASLLKDKHHGVLISAVQLCTELCKASKDALEYLRKVWASFSYPWCYINDRIKTNRQLSIIILPPIHKMCHSFSTLFMDRREYLYL